MVHRRSLSFIFIVLLLLCFTGVQAQSTAPLIIISNGSLWAWNEGETTMRLLMQSGYIQEMTLSPDGNKLAYTELPQVMVDAIERVGGFGGGQLPADIFTMDLTAGTSQRVVAQPPDASFASQNVPDKVIVRSRPVWSPDSFQLAWTEYDLSEDTQQLMVSDEAGRNPRVLVEDVDFSMGVTGPTPVIGWTESGIVLWHWLYAPSQPRGSEQVIEVYSEDGTQVSYTVIPETDNRFLNEVIVLRENNRDYVGIGYNTNEWDLIDLLDGTLEPAATVPELYSTSSAQTSLRVADAVVGQTSTEPTMLVMDAQGSPVSTPIGTGFDANANIVAISPDGQTLALRYYNLQSQVSDPFITLWRDGEGGATSPTQVKGQDQYISSYVWGPTAWALSDLPVIASPVVTALPTSGPVVTLIDCAGAPPTRFAIGMNGRVTLGGGSNNLRALGSKDGVKVGEIPEGGEFTVLDGPVCDGGLVWWRVAYNGETGWTAEGDTSNYYIEPI